jgi:hypothetical protein
MLTSRVLASSRIDKNHSHVLIQVSGVGRYQVSKEKIRKVIATDLAGVSMHMIPRTFRVYDDTDVIYSGLVKKHPQMMKASVALADNRFKPLDVNNMVDNTGNIWEQKVIEGKKYIVKRDIADIRDLLEPITASVNDTPQRFRRVDLKTHVNLGDYVVAYDLGNKTTGYALDVDDSTVKLFNRNGVTHVAKRSVIMSTDLENHDVDYFLSKGSNISANVSLVAMARNKHSNKERKNIIDEYKKWYKELYKSMPEYYNELEKYLDSMYAF